MEKFNAGKLLANKSSVMFGSNEEADMLVSSTKRNIIEVDANTLNYLNVTRKLSDIILKAREHTFESIVIVRNFDSAAITVQSALLCLVKPFTKTSVLFISDKLEIIPISLYRLTVEELMGDVV